MTEVRLTRLQENELELVLAGVFGVREYALPDGDPHVATLLAPADVAAGVGPLELLDGEATPVAKVDVEAVQTTDAGTWVQGPVTELREHATRPFENLRPGTGSPVVAAHVLLDDGHDNPLARAVSEAPDREAVRILPVPAAAHVDAEGRRAHLEWLAVVAFGAGAVVDTAAQDARGNGLVILFTGLSGSGKSTIARELARQLRETDVRPVTLLDGDEVRAMLSSGLGFSREDRELNVRRIGWVSAKIAEHGGIAIAAPIAPYESMRQEVREMAERVGDFMLVHVATPLEVCEARDRKGLYAKARAGGIKEFTGISDPYEVPVGVDLTIGTQHRSAADEAVAVRAGIESQRGSSAPR